MIERRVAAASLQLTFQPTPTEGWWGAARFISAGCLEGLTQDERQRQRVIFDEDMQVGGSLHLGQGTEIQPAAACLGGPCGSHLPCTMAGGVGATRS